MLRGQVQRIVLNGSFVTNIMEPNDVDCVLLVSSDFPKDATAEDELIEGLLSLIFRPWMKWTSIIL